ncbi:hypothetical protein SBI_09243 [Streptomyces bingchenggensis BCW-1]|uniref:Uncharacterized protein n=1 Tax=Streptomyces bingchenggensis (strain BCW-1) TaxID=749414 RepID=D7C3Z5_STRBB|nr:MULTISPECIES: hypothetical protein [Streptomyces]ADI12361.1 hypothetical protein SBI_09243 [Streptomyces bingchenggensis BCW-1]
MPDIVVDYELLNQVAQKASSLKEQVKQARESNQNYTTEQVGGGGVSYAIQAYYEVWKGSFKRSEEKLEQLHNLYEGVARGWADWDFRLAGEAGKQEASLAADLYRTQKEIWDDWQEAVAKGYVDPNDPHAPKPPGERESQWTTTDGHGNTTTTTYEYGPDGKPTKITTTITTSSGLTSTDTTNYHPDGTYDSTATDVYGNVTTTTGNSQTTESGDHKNTKDTFTSTTKTPDGKQSTTTGTTTSDYNSTTGHRDSTTTYTTTGPDDDGKEQTVHGTTTSSLDVNGHEVIETIEVHEDGSGTRTVETDGRKEEWTSDHADQNSGWVTKEDD